ncbi:MAG: EAL domain-containing protein [Epsilonproteobacteria bacterium]|nr:hypothetical protein [Campylobacterota bacterium]NPA56702.1 EAL domain-containing protein [Campylobacterota bacterium]
MGKNFRKLNIKLIIIFLIPAFGMLYFASSYVYEKYKEYRKSIYLDRAIEYISTNAFLIKQLQKERGLTLVATLGDPGFQRALISQRELSDGAIKRYEAIIVKVGPLFDSQLVKEILRQLRELPTIRKEFNDEERWYRIYRYYSDIIRKLIESSLSLEREYINDQFFATIVSFNALLELAESAGKERALITYLISLQRDRERVLMELKKLEIEYEESKKRFLKHAPPPTILLYNKVVPKEVEEAFDKVKREIIYRERFNFIPRSRWWLLATKYINSIYRVENGLLKKLVHLKKRLREEATRQLVLSLILWLGSLVALGGLMKMIKELFVKIDRLLYKLEYEKVFYKTLSQFSEQIFFAENINALVNIYAIYLYKTGFFDYLFLVNDRNEPVVAEGISLQQIREEILHTIEKGLAKVKKKRRYTTLNLPGKPPKKVLLLPIFDGDRLLYITALFLKSRSTSEKLILDIATKMDEYFLFTYRYLVSKREEQSLRSDLEVLSRAFDAHEAITITDSSGKIIKVNKAFERITGYREDEVVGRNPNILKSGRHDKEFYQKMWETIKEQGYWKGEIYNKRKDGTIYPELLSISAIKDSQGNITNYIAHFFDITELKEAQDSIEFSANHDLLTEFFNRKRFVEELEELYKRVKKSGEFGALFYIDMDDFKYINDTYGHDVGDQVLIAFSQRLRELAGEGDILARLGGDEFALLVPSLGKDRERAFEKANQLAKRILDAFAEPITVEDRVFNISLSIGIYLFPHRETEAKEVITNADIAMYYAKRNGKNQFVFFDDKLDHASKEYLIVKNDLEQALEQGELFLVYQPKVRIRDNAIIGFEGLLRWNHPTKGIVGPDRFLFAAKGSRLIFDIGCFVVKEACKMIKKLEYRYPISINISADQFNNNNFLSHTKEILAPWKSETPFLEFEIVEDALVKDLDKTKEIIAELKKLGLTFSIDDFGIGYSSLSYLEQLDVETLKIDKSFILNIFEKRKQEIVRLILETANIFDMRCIAEGVENSRILDLLKEMGFQYYQGYYFSRPVSEEEVMKLVEYEEKQGRLTA